jgi:hypothetical protein
VRIVLIGVVSWLAVACGGVPAPVDRSKPPAVANTAEAFALRTLDALPPIDGRDWIEVQGSAVPGRLPAPNGQFTLTLEEASSVELVHYRISFTEAGAASVELDSGQATYAAITPESRWIIMGPFELVDVPTWRRYSLSTAFNLRAFIVLRAISADGRRNEPARSIAATSRIATSRSRCLRTDQRPSSARRPTRPRGWPV